MTTSTKRTLGVLVPWIILVHVVLFLAFWLTNSLFYSEVNDYLTNLLGARSDYISICLGLSVLVGVWSIARGAFGRGRLRHPLQGLTAWLYGIVAVVYIVFFYGSFWYLFRQSPIQPIRLAQMLAYFRIVFDPLLLIAVTGLAVLWSVKRLAASKKTGSTSYLAAVAPPALACALVWAALLVFPPDAVYAGALPDKPRVIAHRGASMLAPENTLVAMERAAALGTYGVETDLSLSRDGIPFLMHDTTLKRTTNVAALFPGRDKNKAEDFTLAEVRQLNAGEWFVTLDPYRAIAGGAIPAVDIQQYRQQRVPTLAEELDIVRKNKLIFIFDLKELSAPSASGQSFFDIVLKQVHDAGIDSQVWFLVDRQELQTLRATAPAMHPAYGANYRQLPAAADLHAQGYEVVNAEYGLPVEWIKRYRAAGLWVNLWTIDEPWQYSRLWLSGVNSVTSSNSHALLALDQPLLALPYSTYLLLWSALGVLCLAVVFGVALHRMRG